MSIKNSTVVGKHVIVKDLAFTDFLKDDHNEIVLFDSYEDAGDACGIYEFKDALILKVVHNYIDDGE